MPRVFYSFKDLAFYNDIVSTPEQMSEDAVEISQELYLDLLEGESLGKIIVRGDEGLPVLAERPTPPVNMDLVKAKALAERDRRLTVAAIRIAPLQDAVDLDESTADDVTLLKKWKQYRVAVNRVQDQGEYPLSIDWPVEPS